LLSLSLQLLEKLPLLQLELRNVFAQAEHVGFGTRLQLLEFANAGVAAKTRVERREYSQHAHGLLMNAAATTDWSSAHAQQRTPRDVCSPLPQRFLRARPATRACALRRARRVCELLQPRSAALLRVDRVVTLAQVCVRV
jgi:hypothetical protein